MPAIHVVGAAIVQANKCLVAQRGPTMSLPGKWEFPGGKVEPDEAPALALAREIAEELNLRIAVHQLLGSGMATVGSHVVTLDVYAATITAGTLALREHAEIVWATADDLARFDWAEADIPSLGAVAAWLRTSSP